MLYNIYNSVIVDMNLPPAKWEVLLLLRESPTKAAILYPREGRLRLPSETGSAESLTLPIIKE